MKKWIAMFFNRWIYKQKTLKYLLIQKNYHWTHHGFKVENSLVCYSFETKKDLNDYISKNLSKNDKKKAKIYKLTQSSD